MEKIINKFIKVKNQAFTLMELIIVIIIMGLLMGVYSYYKGKMIDINTLESIFVNNIMKEMLNNRVKYKNSYYYDIPAKYCPGWDFNNCDWDSDWKCIIWKFRFSELPNASIDLKKLIKNITSYEICPKFLPDWTLNDKYVGHSHQDPSFSIDFKMNGLLYNITYPEY